jgi:polyphosphate:AMP phosphotransferase
MFEDAELGQKLKKKEYLELVPGIRSDLVRLQYALGQADFPVVIALEGDDRVGVRQAINVANQWFDPRFLGVEVYSVRGEHEAEDDYPHYWRYWRRLPARGQMAIMSNAWTLHAILEQMRRDEPDDALLERRMYHIQRFEDALVEDGTLLVKLWLHVPKSVLKKRLEAAKEDPLTTWQITEEDHAVFDNYGEVREISEAVLRRTSTGQAPWCVIESSDARYRDLSIANALREALTARLARSGARDADPPAPAPVPAPASAATPEGALPTKTLLDTVDLSASISESKYEKQLVRHQAELSRLTRAAFDECIPSVLVFQGWDAAGKGGTIRRVTAAIDASICRVVPIAAPSDEEAAHHYLWRFWRRLPRRGRVRIFDRSWYERVLVERVEGLASEPEWRRAYQEIRDFEEHLCEQGVVMLKFWLHIDADEQLRRFEDREQTEFKRFKITEEDYRNRERRPAYEVAVNEMIVRTDQPKAPWHMIPANDKRYARIKVLKTFCNALEKAL